MDNSDLERLAKLRTYLAEFAYEDRRSINNSIFVGQHTEKIAPIYADFRKFSRLGVASFELNWDYSNLRVNFREANFPMLESNEISRIKTTARFLSKFSPEELQFVSCLCSANYKSLTPIQKQKANNIRQEIITSI